MAEFENNQEITPNSKPTTNKMTSSSIFNRSLTIHSTSVTKPYLQSTSGFYNIFESMKGKVKKLRSLFESPKPNPNELQIQATNKLQSVKSMGPEYNRFPEVTGLRMKQQTMNRWQRLGSMARRPLPPQLLSWVSKRN